MIVVVDLEMGNLESVARAFRRVKQEVTVSSVPDVIEKADKIVLPGVGWFSTAMKNVRDLKILPVLERRVFEDKVPLLGICLGMQMLTRYSEEGGVKGLGWVEAEARRFDFSSDPDNGLKVPHMGWNDVSIKKEHALLGNLTEASNFYFQHSYAVTCEDESAILATSVYGYDFVSIVQKDNIYGTQFHPEKSHANGLQLLRNFVELER
jgi:imidazole glycerol-phosphate synthase subunit HisH